ncbi:large ribosomal subunit protein P2-like [Liolophura sinensis]|uniref:large ribosomal subunit protein P2-like n=1 Tax=Liolophura sinensis TaxID=3198878 RepID=UPI003158A937
MRYVAAYLLATLGGNASPSNKDIEKILGSVGIDVEADKVKKVIDELKGKSIEQVIAEGEKKLASVPSGGAVAAGGAAPAAGGGGGAAPEAKKEEKKEEPEEESDDDMGFGLFD